MSALHLLSGSMQNAPRYSEATRATGFWENAVFAAQAEKMDTPFFANADIYDQFSERNDLLKTRFPDRDLVAEAEKAVPMMSFADAMFSSIDAQKEIHEQRKAWMDERIMEGRSAQPEAWRGVRTNKEITDDVYRRTRFAKEMREDMASRGGSWLARNVAPFAGEMVGASADPVNVATLPIGAGVSTSANVAYRIIRTALIEGGINAGVELYQLPEYADLQEKLGTPMTMSDAAYQVALAGTAGAVFGGGIASASAAGRATARSWRATRTKRKEIMQKMADNASLPRHVRSAASYLVRKTELADTPPPDLERKVREAMGADDASLREQPHMLDAVEYETLQMHRAALQETYDALAEGRTPVYHELLRDTDAVLRNHHQAPEAEVQAEIAKRKAALPDFERAHAQEEALLKQQRKEQGETLLEFIGRSGGAWDDGGELTHINAQLWHRGKRFRSKVIRDEKKRGSGNDADYSLDALAHKAWEAGYLQSEERPTVNDLLAKIEDELRGQPVYAHGIDIDARNNMSVDEDAYRYETQRMERAEELGINTTDRSLQEIDDAIIEYETRRELEEKYARQARDIEHEADRVYGELIRSGVTEEHALAYHALFTSSYHAFMRRYANVSQGVAATIRTMFEGVSVQRGALDAQSDMALEGETFAQSTAPVATLSGKELPPHSKDTAVANARAWYRANLQGKSVVREDIGKVEFTGKGWEKAKSGVKVDPDKYLLFPALREIIEKGETKGRTLLDKQRTDGAVAFHFIEANLLIGDRLVKAGVTVMERQDGSLFYNINKDPDVLLQKKMEKADPRNIAQELSPQSNASKTLNQSQEPLVGDGINLEIIRADDAALPRGSITFNRGQSFIQLLENADATTFIHEMGHFYMRVMHEIASLHDAPADLMADYAAMRAFVGAGEGARFSVAQEERIAGAFEEYIRTGNAPTEALRGAFYKLRMWFEDIYKAIRGTKTPITPEIRAVFDRWLAPNGGRARDFIDTPNSYMPTREAVNMDDSRIVDAAMSDFMRLVRDRGDEVDDALGMSYRALYESMQEDERVLEAMQVCVR